MAGITILLVILFGLSILSLAQTTTAALSGIITDATGASVAGALWKDRTFLFGAYEGLRQRLATSNRFVVPTADARQGILPSGTIMVNPAVVPYLNLYPLPNAGDAGGS